MAQNKLISVEILPSIPCSRNLRRRTGVWLGIEAWELVVILCLSMIPDFLYRVGLISQPNLFVGIIISGCAMGFVILFKKNKPPNYFSIWLHHHFLHPKAWRAPRSTSHIFPILDDHDGKT